MKKTIRLLHISDLHLSADTFNPPRGRDYFEDRLKNALCKPASPSLAEAVARTMYYKQHELDAILITGDIATSGTVEDLHAALSFFESEPAEQQPWMTTDRQPTLQGIRCPILLMPGNHDRYRDRVGSPGGDLFDRVFGQFWTGGQGVQMLQVNTLLWIVACDLTLDRDEGLPLMDLPGKGKAYQRRLDQLREKTRQLRVESPKAVVLWAIHFPPRFRRCCEELSIIDQIKMMPLDLIDEDLLIKEAQTARVDYILCGHTHWSHFYCADKLKTVPFVHCAGSAMQLGKKPNTIHLVTIDIEVDGQIESFSHSKLEFKASHGCFA